MISRKKVINFSQRQRELDELANQQARLSFFSRLTQRIPAKIVGAVISALIVFHFVSQFIFFQNEIDPNEVTAPKIESAQLGEIKPEHEPVQPDVAAMPEPDAVVMPEPVAQPIAARRKAEPPPRTVKKKQPRESKATAPRRAERKERVYPPIEVDRVYAFGRFLQTRSAIRPNPSADRSRF